MFAEFALKKWVEASFSFYDAARQTHFPFPISLDLQIYRPCRRSQQLSSQHSSANIGILDWRLEH
jgi:hypothetical protein